MEKRSLQRWRDDCLYYSSSKLYTQDKYLNLKTSEVLSYLKGKLGSGELVDDRICRSIEGLSGSTWMDTAGDTIDIILTTIDMAQMEIEDGICEDDGRDIRTERYDEIYALVIAPFAAWLEMEPTEGGFK